MAGLDLKLIVGLGNPGPEYAQTRHNAGFWVVDELARRFGGSLRPQARYHGEAGRIVVAGQEIWLLKPMTFMNRSGIAQRALADYLKILPAQTLVVHDEIDLPVATLRLKLGGGSGGHNGLKDLIAHVGEGFWRARLGVGHPGRRSEVIDYVLKRAPASEDTLLQVAAKAAADLVPELLDKGAEVVMNRLHRALPSV